MKIEYLIFNLIIFLSPFFSYILYSKIVYPKNFIYFLSMIISSLIFIYYDIKVNNKWWKFNKKYILNIKIFNLPIEEILFFFTVSFSCLVIWLNLNKTSIINIKNFQSLNFIFFIFIFIYYFYLYFKTKKPYPRFIFYLYSLLILLDLILKINLFFRLEFLFFSIINFILTLIFNYYLTKRPIVIYNKKYKSNIKILTIPIEDFLYGFNFVYLLVLLTEFFSKLSILSK